VSVLLDAVDAAVCVLETANGGLRLIDANCRALELLGASSADALAGNLRQVFAGDALGALERAQSELARGTRTHVSCDVARLNGHRLQVGLSASSAGAGELVVTLVDLSKGENSELSRREAQLAESEARFRTMANYAPVLLWLAAPDARCVFFNDVWLKFTGRSLEEEFGTGWAEGIHPEDFQGTMQSYLAAFVEREPFRIEYRLRRQDGQFRWLLDHGVPRFAPDGSFAGYIGSCIDITELKDVYRRLTVRLRERDVLLREVHHRVKNNLQLVSSLLSVQARRLGDNGSRSALNDSRNRVQTIALIHEVLYRASDFSHVAFADYIQRLCKHVMRASSAATDRIELELELADVALGIDRAIPCGLILNELLVNSLKHGFPDGREGRIRVELREDPAERIMLTVADDGVGLPAQFDLRSADTVGMQIVHTLAEQLEAELEVTRRGGTTFRFGFMGAG
jgi:PAS domain S-box-containing protein